LYSSVTRHKFVLPAMLFVSCLVQAPTAVAQPAVPVLPACISNFGKRIEERSLTTPAIGESHETEVGGVVLNASTIGVIDDGIKLLSDVAFTGKRGGADFVINVPAGDYRAGDFRGLAYPAPLAGFRYQREQKDRHGLSKPDISLWVEGSTLKANVDFGLSSTDYPVGDAHFAQRQCIRVATKALRREILYSGGAKGVISLQYREFLSDYARPAFSQELTFDLNNGKEIGFRGARIRIENTSNLGIRYTVLKPLD